MSVCRITPSWDELVDHNWRATDQTVDGKHSQIQRLQRVPPTLRNNNAIFASSSAVETRQSSTYPPVYNALPPPLHAAKIPSRPPHHKRRKVTTPVEEIAG
ncbi:hypothetical protein GLAREA_11445 [Glarea lozoyensis ATCC 20868]|uniref:Uncharacterized protein n=1 Tax=Glarea lozoyensis (strain ATCC 20868 / MF5171) TaxID=1116229 RepID=S3CHX5_GLAL2|nr:uncharacterized protein GLAREA_11445 [Glarea lozoyensis ATCC 20868]EPE24864.1 hypothetical protein GLAREA_11445 [Glarea lozoyensis ATCC 20868]